MTGADGDRYDGDYQGGLRHGHGIYVASNGERFEGEYVRNQRVAAAPGRTATQSQSPSPSPAVTAAPAAPATPAALAMAAPNPPAARPASATQPAPAAAASGDFAIMRCDAGFLATIAVATKEPLGLPNEDAFTFAGNGQMPGAAPAAAQAVARSAAVRLAKEAVAYASRNRAVNCRVQGLPPIISDVVLIFKDRVPNKVPPVGKDTAASVPGLLVYVEYGVGDTWHMYNAAFQREKIEAANKKDNAAQTALARFASKHGVLDKEAKGLYANPFAFEGEKLLLITAFEQMQTASSGLFYVRDEGIVVVNDLPKGAFMGKSKVILAAKVLGNVKFDGVVEGVMQVHGMVPNLKFLGALVCRNDRCSETDEK